MKSREKHDHRQDTSPPLMLSDRDMKPLEGLNWDALALYWSSMTWLVSGGNGYRMEVPKGKLLQAVQRRRPLRALEAAACELVEEGIWADRDTHWEVLLHQQPDIDSWRDPVRRERDLRRKRLYRDTDLCRRIRERDRMLCRYCGTRTRWDGDKKSPSYGTYDHINPDGDNSFENVVVACNRCNSRKQERTPEQASMSLYAPGTTADDIRAGRGRAIVSRSTSRATSPDRKARSDLGPPDAPGDSDLDRIQIGTSSGPDVPRARPRPRTDPDRTWIGSGSEQAPQGDGPPAPTDTSPASSSSAAGLEL